MNRVERLLHYTATPPEAPLALARGQRWDPKLRQIVGPTGACAAVCVRLCVCVCGCVCAVVC